MELKEEVANACKRMVEQKLGNIKAQRRALLDKRVQSAVTIIERYHENLTRAGIKAVGTYTTSGGYEAKYSGESVSGSISIVDMDHATAEGRADGKLVVSVNYRAHSCAERSNYEGEIPESDVMEFVKYATRQPTLVDRWKRMSGEYKGDF